MMARICVSIFYPTSVELDYRSFQESVRHVMYKTLGMKYADGQVTYNKISINQLGLIKTYVWRHHRLLEAVISDRGSAFMFNFSKELAMLLDI